jgi:hypothetical protein
MTGVILADLITYYIARKAKSSRDSERNVPATFFHNKTHLPTLFIDGAETPPHRFDYIRISILWNTYTQFMIKRRLSASL